MRLHSGAVVNCLIAAIAAKNSAVAAIDSDDKQSTTTKLSAAA